MFAEIQRTTPLSTFVSFVVNVFRILNLTVVRELQSVQRAEATDRHERCSFVPIDKRMVDDDEMEQLERFPVERLEDVVKVTLTDVLAGGSHR